MRKCDPPKDGCDRSRLGSAHPATVLIGHFRITSRNQATPQACPAAPRNSRRVAIDDCFHRGGRTAPPKLPARKRQYEVQMAIETTLSAKFDDAVCHPIAFVP